MKGYKIGEKLLWTVDDFDGYSESLCVVTEIHNDHVIAKCDDMNLWIDEDTQENFKKL